MSPFLPKLTRKLTTLSGSLEITLEGTPEEVLIETNRLYNFGAIAPRGIPNDYREGLDDYVILKTYKNMLLTGLLSMVQADMLNNKPLLKRLKGKKGNGSVWMMIAAYRVSKILRSFLSGGFVNAYGQNCHRNTYQEADFSDLSRDKGMREHLTY